MKAITDAARTDLHNRVRDVLGEQEGDTLMAHLPPVGWADVATKQDLAPLAEKNDVLALQVSMERGFRRQTVWVTALIVAQNAWFAAVVLRG